MTYTIKLIEDTFYIMNGEDIASYSNSLRGFPTEWQAENKLEELEAKNRRAAAQATQAAKDEADHTAIKDWRIAKDAALDARIAAGFAASKAGK